MREIDRDAVRGGEGERAVGVVAVLVGQKDRADAGRLEAESCQAPLGLGEGEAAVQHDQRAGSLGHQAVARAAAAERSETQQIT